MFGTDVRWTYRSEKGKPLTKKQFTQLLNQIQQNMQSVTKPFTDDSEKAKKERREQGRQDIEKFKELYFPHYCTKPSGEIHKEMHEICNTGNKSINAIAIPREHAKSVNCTLIEPIWKAVYNISKYTILVSDTLALAEEFLNFIRYEFENNERLIQDFGDLVTPGSWTSTDILIGNKARVRALGAGMRIRGTRFRMYRPQYIIIDDLENDINVKNKSLVKERLRWLLGAVFPSLDDNGTLVMVGTMLDKISVLSLLIQHINDNKEEIQKEFGCKAMNAVIYSAIKEDGTPLWPEGKTLKKLMQIKKMVGPVVWAAEFMNKPIDTGLYKLEWFHGYDRSILFLLPKNWVYFSGSDPSARDGEQADYKAHVVVALDQEAQKRYIAEAWIKKRIMADFFNAYIDLFMEYRMIQSAFEINGFQLFIQMELAKLCRDKGLWPNFKLVTHTQDKVARCGRWAGMVERADLLFDRSHSDQELLILQFNALGTKEHDDGPDAADMGLEGSMDWRGKFTFKSAGRREITGRGYRQRPSFSARRELLG